MAVPVMKMRRVAAARGDRSRLPLRFRSHTAGTKRDEFGDKPITLNGRAVE